MQTVRQDMVSSDSRDPRIVRYTLVLLCDALKAKGKPHRVMVWCNKEALRLKHGRVDRVGRAVPSVGVLLMGIAAIWRINIDLNERERRGKGT